MKKNILLSLLAGSAVMLSLPYVINAIKNNTTSEAEELSYTLSFNKDTNILEDSTEVSTKDVTTSKGNTVSFSYKNVSHPTRGLINWENMTSGGYFKNTTAITGISHIDYFLSDNGNGLYLYYDDSAISGTSDRTYIYESGSFDFENTYPSYFELRNEDDSTASILYLKIYYTCKENSVTPTDKSMFDYTYEHDADGYVVSIKEEYANSIREVTLPSDFMLSESDKDPTPIVGIAKNGFRYSKGLSCVHIPSSYTYIGREAFSGCGCLDSITIPSGITYISEKAFYECSDLKSVSLPETLTSIGPSAFEDCTSLAKINLPNGINNIDMYAFSGCTKLNITHLPESLTSFKHYSFNNCSSLTRINLGKDVSEFYCEALTGCNSIESIVVDSENSKFDSRNSCNAIIETNLNRLVFGCMSTVIPDGVQAIGGGAFGEAKGLQSISFPSSVTTIESQAFRNCTSLTSIYIPATVTKIGNPENFGTNHNPFMGCSALEEIVVSEENPYYNLHNETNCIVNSNNELIAGCINTVIPSNVTVLLDSAFSGALFTEFVIPNTVVQLKTAVFKNCTSLTKINIPESVQTLGPSVFYNCTSLKYVFIPTSVSSIGGQAFENCPDVIIYTPYESMPDKWAFSLYPYTVVFDWLGDPVTYDSITYAKHNKGYSVHEYSGDDTTLVIPSSEDSNTIFRIDEEVFKDCTSLETVIIPNGVETIESKAFSGCSNLYNLVIGSGVTTIASDAFEGCSRIIGHSDGVFYMGNASGWNNIENASTIFAGQNIYYYSEEKPTSHIENYWHFDTDGVTILFWY